MSTYFTSDDIKSNLASGFDLTPYLAEADSEIVDVAERLGVRTTSSISTPLHYKLKRYGVVFILMRLAQDKLGTNNPDIQLEKYGRMYEMYKQELRDLFPQITYEMITGNVNNIIGRTAVYNLYRG